jgi:hypothetical protein
MVGLNPNMRGMDIPSFPMRRARLTDALFLKILDDIDDMTMQYGYMDYHQNEESRSRFLSAVRLSSNLRESL